MCAMNPESMRMRSVALRAKLDQVRAGNDDQLRRLPLESVTSALELILVEIDHLEDARTAKRFLTRTVIAADLLELALRLAAVTLSDHVNDRCEEDLDG
jgi:hypothetical protein